MNDTNETGKSTKSLNDMTLDEIMEYRRVHDREVISQVFMKGASVELKTLGEKKNILLTQRIYEDVRGQAFSYSEL